MTSGHLEPVECRQVHPHRRAEAQPRSAADRLEMRAWQWPEITSGTDLGVLVSGLPDLADGDVVALTSKVVSKAEGRFSADARDDVVRRETSRVVARRGETVIAQTRLGLVMAAAGVDASNVVPGRVLLLPVDPDESARSIRTAVATTTGLNVAVVITDTAGRAWREGQTDLAVGVAGLRPLVDLVGTLDTYGNRLSVTAPAVADEIAAAADLVKGKTSQRPVAIVHGLAHLVLPAGEHGPGAGELVRRASDDLFGLGAREAVVAAVRRNDQEALAHFTPVRSSDPAPFDGMSSSSARVGVDVRAIDDPTPGASIGWQVRLGIRADAEPQDWIELGRLVERVETLAAAHRLREQPRRTDDQEDPDWRCWTCTRWTVA